METMSKRPKTACIDKFSCLPVDVAHNVLSSLSIDDLSRLSVVSKRFRRLCMTIPFLTVDDTIYRSNASKRAQLMNYIDRFLILRKGMDIQYFNIKWCLQSGIVNEEYRVLSWVQNAVICNVKKLRLSIQLRRESNFTLPHSLLGCVFLESFRLKFRNGFATLKIPSSITHSGFSSLKSLKLRSVKLDESFGDWVSSNCKCLEELVLIYIRGTKSITITSSSLKTLDFFFVFDLVHLHVSAEVLERMALFWQFSSHDNRRLQLFTPKLEIFNFLCVGDMFDLGLQPSNPKLEMFNFIWTGDIFNFRLTENFLCLVEGRMCPNPSSSIASYDKLVYVLRAVGKLRGLVLYDDSIQDLFKRGCLPLLFTELLALHVLITGIANDLVPVLAAFLKGTPNLHWLSISRKDTQSHSSDSEEEDGRIMGHEDLHDIPFLHNLKFVTIELVSREKNELEMIKYLLEHASNLQRMTVLYAPPYPSDVSREITGYKKASFNTEVNFRPI